MDSREPIEDHELASCPKGPWICFHCEEVCETVEQARDHFGSGNYESEMPLCIEAATAEQKDLVRTNREMWERLLKVEEDLEQAEFERDCWAQAGRKAVGDPYATWHDIGQVRRDADNRIAATEAALNAAPRWLRRILRWKAERDWKRGRRAMEKLRREAEALL